MKRMSDWHDSEHFKETFNSLNNQNSKLLIVNIESKISDNLLLNIQTYSEPCQKSKMEHFGKMFND